MRKAGLRVVVAELRIQQGLTSMQEGLTSMQQGLTSMQEGQGCLIPWCGWRAGLCVECVVGDELSRQVLHESRSWRDLQSVGSHKRVLHKE